MVTFFPFFDRISVELLYSENRLSIRTRKHCSSHFSIFFSAHLFNQTYYYKFLFDKDLAKIKCFLLF
jgi:hypothetical protein